MMIGSSLLDLIAADPPPCSCGCPRVIRTVDDLRRVRANHPGKFDNPADYDTDPDDVEVAIDRRLEDRDRWAEGGMRVQEVDLE